MATYYVSSVVGDNSDGLTWATAKTSVAAGLALATADGDIILVDSAHVFTSGAAITWDVPTSNTHVSIISVNRNGSTTTGYSAFLAGAKETVGVNAAAFAIGSTTASYIQRFFIYGMYIEANNGASTSNTITLAPTTSSTLSAVFQSCTLSTPGTGTSAEIILGPTTIGRKTILKFQDCSVIAHNSSNAAAAVIRTEGGVYAFFSGLTISYAGANKPPSLFRVNSTTSAGKIEVTDSDLSGFNTGALVLLTNLTFLDFTFVNCKLHATPTVTSGTWPNEAASSITMVNCDSGDTKTLFKYINWLGTITSTTSIYADDGAQMAAVNVGWQVVTSASAAMGTPFITPWIQKWGGSTAAQTQSFELIHDNATDLTNQNLWAEFERVSDASFPLGTLLSVRNAEPFAGSAADWPNSSTTWTGTGGFANPNKQTVGSGSITPAEVSLLRARLFVGVASKTLYLDPNLRIA